MEHTDWMNNLSKAQLQELLSSTVAPTRDELSEHFPELEANQLLQLEQLLAGKKQAFEDPASTNTPAEKASTSTDQLAPDADAPAAQVQSAEETVVPAAKPVEPVAASVVESQVEALTQDAPSASEQEDGWSFGDENGWGSFIPTVKAKDFLDVPVERIRPYNFVENLQPVAQVNLELEDHTAGIDDDIEEEQPVSVVVYWDSYETDATKVFYRVVASDKEEQLTPEAGQTLVFTRGNAFREELSETTGMRIYRVWAYYGETPMECIARQPKLVGEEIVIVPPRDFKIVETDGAVTGTWTPMRGHKSVKLYVREHGSAVEIDDPQNQIRGVATARDFSYSRLSRGKTYEFQIVPVVEFEGNERSGKGSRIIKQTISADIQAIDIKYAKGLPGKEGRLNKIMLSWPAPPTGVVKIYLTDKAPKPDIIGLAVENEYIEDDLVLSATDYVKVFDSLAPGETTEHVLDWPVGWDRVFCTPVNVVGDQSMVGDFKVVSRVAEIEEYTLHERVSSQLVTFDWPRGAGFIDILNEDGNVTKQLFEEEYRRQGGVRLELPPLSMSFQLIPKSIYAGEETSAKPTQVEYAGRKVFQYAIERNEQLVSLNFWVWRQGVEELRPPLFQVVYHPTRLPLSARDGETVSVFRQRGPESLTEPAPVLRFDELAADPESAYQKGNGIHWVLNPAEFRRGYYRMFVVAEDLETDRSQIMVDPDYIASLHADPQPGE